MKNIASTGKSVICTIHQPSSEVFAMFDRILLMAEGRTAYLGPATETLAFFSSQGLPCPANYNPADFFIHTLATVPGQETECKKRSKAVCDAYDLSPAGQLVADMARANRSIKTIESRDPTEPVVKVKRSPYKAPWLAQFKTVLWRSVLSVSREPSVVRIKVFQTLVSISFHF